jgi:hypothetical protein
MLGWLLSMALLGVQDVALTSQNRAEWMAAVEPDATETAYRAIAWRNQFWPAVEEARELGRPILFWTMNGHPLGCT